MSTVSGAGARPDEGDEDRKRDDGRMLEHDRHHESDSARGAGLDANGLEVLDRAECVRLLGGASIGRVGVTDRALPVVLPVNFALDGDDVIVRTNAGSKLDAALRGAVVAFEADGTDPLYHGGWSVLVQGRATLVDEAAELERLQGLPLAPWGVTGDHYIRITSEVVSGRRLPKIDGAMLDDGGWTREER